MYFLLRCLMLAYLPSVDFFSFRLLCLLVVFPRSCPLSYSVSLLTLLCPHYSLIVHHLSFHHLSFFFPTFMLVFCLLLLASTYLHSRLPRPPHRPEALFDNRHIVSSFSIVCDLTPCCVSAPDFPSTSVNTPFLSLFLLHAGFVLAILRI